MIFRERNSELIFWMPLVLDRNSQIPLTRITWQSIYVLDFGGKRAIAFLFWPSRELLLNVRRILCGIAFGNSNLGISLINWLIARSSSFSTSTLRLGHNSLITMHA